MSAHVSYVTAAREVLARRLADGQLLTTQDQLMEALSVLPEEKRRVYEAIRQLKRRGELVAEGNGFRYLPEASPEPLSDRIYRVIRAHNGGFTANDISSTAEINPARVRNFIESLAASGYLKEVGRQGQAKIWMATQLCRDTPKPPRLNYSQGTFIMERRAVAALVDIFMSAADLAGSRTAESIREQLDILYRRFGVKGVTDDSQKS